MSLDWAAVKALPPFVRAAMPALRLDQPDFSGLEALDERQWHSLLDWLDRQQLTLLFGHVCAGRLPERVAQRIEGNFQANRLRQERLREEYRSIARALAAGCIPHVVLKGFTHGPPYVPSLDLRPQYDLDLFIPRDRLDLARRALLDLGFDSANPRESAPTDHYPPLVRRTGWQWKGDYFDPDIPPVVELHHRLWDSATEGFDAPGLADLPGRVSGDPPAFDSADRPAYAAAHALRHLLRGSLKALHVYELAHLLHTTQEDETWDRWKGRHPGELRRLQSVVFGLARCWFGCGLPAAVAADRAALPASVRVWLERYAASPLSREFRPNKEELWLHLELTDGWASSARVARRRLAPLSLPGPLEGQYDEGDPPIRERLTRSVRYAAFASRRAAFHSVSLGMAAIEGIRWIAVRKSVSEPRP